jgi:hypothetical protein
MTMLTVNYHHAIRIEEPASDRCAHFCVLARLRERIELGHGPHENVKAIAFDRRARDELE